ncbi:putative Fungal specific transcription factor [Cladophialophora carrionii]|uniref:Putative Fungal specific transcription factor n=1 Tax=Cladophialophora carrionii TaxID=86049 RepID=A0A1C1CTD9_9EURO|nr:putative Fungal specific transcription factor [Cladophialophora carrionii]
MKLREMLAQLQSSAPGPAADVQYSTPSMEHTPFQSPAAPRAIQRTSTSQRAAQSVPDARQNNTRQNRPQHEQNQDQQRQQERSQDEQDTLDISPFLSVDEQGNINSFGPSSALHSSVQRPTSINALSTQHIQNGLIARAALARQNEHELYHLSEIEGVPIELAMHLFDLHWNRQHHSFLLTYRPVVMRDLRQKGPYSSRFLVNAIFAGESKFSERLEVRDNPDDPMSAGARFFRRCDQLLYEDSLLAVPRIPTVSGLLLLGSSFIARGEISKGWLYTGYALRMVYDLGLHLDRELTHENAEEVEVRRRVFWGAFICDKLQSLYVGRPIAIHLEDAHVSWKLLDTIEERDLYIPYLDPLSADLANRSKLTAPSPICSVSCFEQLCLLSKIMTRIINKFYVIGATAKEARASLDSIDESLVRWNTELPSQLRLDMMDTSTRRVGSPTPNIMNLHAVYHSLVILLHRPFISVGHLHSVATPMASWNRCTIAAKHITNVALTYRGLYSLRGAAYMLGYSLYVACTIHVRNAATLGSDQGLEHSTYLAGCLSCLREMRSPNNGISVPVKIIQKIISARNITLPSETSPPMAVSFKPSQMDYQDPIDFDMDAIFATFSSEPLAVQGSAPSAILDTTDMLGQGDLLYGFLDGQFSMDG